MSLLFNMLSRFMKVFFPRSKHLFISWLQSPSRVIQEPKKIKSVTASTFSLSICHEMTGPAAMMLVFWILSFKPAFSLSFFTLIKRLFNSSLLSAIRAVSSVYLRLLIFLTAILIKACDSSSTAFCMMRYISQINWVTTYSLVLLSQYRTNLLFHVVLSVAPWPSYRFCKRRVRRSVTPMSLSIARSSLRPTQSRAAVSSMKQK